MCRKWREDFFNEPMVNISSIRSPRHLGYRAFLPNSSTCWFLVQAFILIYKVRLRGRFLLISSVENSFVIAASSLVFLHSDKSFTFRFQFRTFPSDTMGKSSRLGASGAPSNWRSSLKPEDAEKLRKTYEIPSDVNI
ncbi:hypothetical protein SLA2020_275960 [Shorea laevis]